MGHHLDSKSSIVPLIDRPIRDPIGLVDNEKLREIPALPFSDEEAFIASCFPLEETTLGELSYLTKRDPRKPGWVTILCRSSAVSG